MKIGFLAMSGLRAHDPDLLALGLTLPGVVERGEVVASMPSLGLLWLAAVTPEHHDVCYLEAEDATAVPPEAFECDVVAISALTAQAFEAYKAARLLKEAGVRTAMGGLHATVLPEEVAQHVDWTFVGEAEYSWPLLLAEIEKGPAPSAGRIIRGNTYGTVDLDQLPTPRYDLLTGGNWNRFPLQTTRGCPWRCDFCASSIMLDLPYRKRSQAAIAADLERIHQVQNRPFIELADDNTFVDHRWGLKLCETLAENRVQWFTETDISVAEDETLLTALREARCRQLLIGLESPGPEDLHGIELKTNFKERKAGQYRDAIRRIQDHGITVNGCFVLGLDHQGPDIFNRIYDFAMEIPLYEVQITVMTPFPGTPLYDRLLKEGRILEPGRWDLCTLFDVNFQPARMSVEQLRRGFYELVQRLYSQDCIEQRRRSFWDQQWAK